MKYAVTFMFALALLVGVQVASAEVECGDGHAVYDRTNTKVVSCISKAEWSRAEQEVAKGISDTLAGASNLLSVGRGVSFLTTYGYVDTCPAWYPFGCVAPSDVFVAWR